MVQLTPDVAARPAPLGAARRAIEMRGVAKAFGPQAVLSSFDWEVPSGSFALLLGSPGAGKTTALRLLAGFSACDRGTVRLFGEDSGALSSAARARVALAPEVTGFPHRMRGRELARCHARWWPGFEHERFSSLCEALEVSPEARVGGLDERARRTLGIALALAQQAELTLLDEAFTGLAARPAERLGRLLAEVARGPARTVVATAPAVGAWSEGCDILNVLSGGRSVLCGAKDELCVAARELALPLERYVHVAAAVQRAGLLTTRTEERVRTVTVTSYPDELAALIAAIDGAEVRRVDLAGLYAAAIDLSSTGTGTAPE